MPHEDFERILDRIVEDARNRSSVAIVGDFNAWAMEWGSKETKKRGQTLLVVFSVLDLTLLNDGEKSTFIRGEASSMIDLTFVSSGLLKGDTCWRVSDTCTQCDHCAIAWRVVKQRESENRPPKINKSTGSKASAFDADAIRLGMEGGCVEGSSAKEKVQDGMRKVTFATEAISGKRWKSGRKKYCLLVTLDVRNALNSDRWKNICQALHKLDVPVYLKNMIKSYLTNRLQVTQKTVQKNIKSLGESRRVRC